MRRRMKTWLRAWLDIDDIEHVQDNHANALVALDNSITLMQSNLQVLNAQQERLRNNDRLRRSH